MITSQVSHRRPPRTLGPPFPGRALGPAGVSLLSRPAPATRIPRAQGQGGIYCVRFPPLGPSEAGFRPWVPLPSFQFIRGRGQPAAASGAGTPRGELGPSAPRGFRTSPTQGSGEVRFRARGCGAPIRAENRRHVWALLLCQLLSRVQRCLPPSLKVLRFHVCTDTSPFILRLLLTLFGSFSYPCFFSFGHIHS